MTRLMLKGTIVSTFIHCETSAESELSSYRAYRMFKSISSTKRINIFANYLECLSLHENI